MKTFFAVLTAGLSVRRMGADGQHVKLALRDKNGKVLQMLAFNAPEEFFREPRKIGRASWRERV